MAKKIVEIEVLVATAPFDEGGRHYEPGDEFEVPANWQRDFVHEEIVNQKGGNRVCFMQPEIQEDKAKKIEYKPGRRVLLPVSLEAAAPATPEKA